MRGTKEVEWGCTKEGNVMYARNSIEISDIVLNSVFAVVSAVFATPFGIIAAWYVFGA